jgi:hypothetical protein
MGDPDRVGGKASRASVPAQRAVAVAASQRRADERDRAQSQRVRAGDESGARAPYFTTATRVVNVFPGVRYCRK